MKKLLIMTLFLSSFSSIAAECGIYNIEGIIKKEGDRFFFYTNPNTLSQKKIEFDSKINSKIFPLDHVKINSKAYIKINGTKDLSIYKIEETKLARVQALKSTDKIEFSKKINCE